MWDMTGPTAAKLVATIHVLQQATVVFHASDLWPLEGSYTRFGDDLSAFAGEVLRRFHTDGYVGFSLRSGEITVIPLAAVKRLDFAQLPNS
jgi:hypothetical protein